MILPEVVASLIAPPETEEFPVEKLAPNGDVILIVGTEKKRIQIHSDFLRLVSPIFDTMLQSQSTMPHESRGVCQMELPGDDGQAMSLLLRALYGGDPELDSLKPKEIQQISMLANKYGMAPRVSRQAVTWLHGTKMKDPEEFWYLLNAAYWLERPESFRLISKGVVKFANISLLQLASGTTDVLRGFRLACKYLWN